MEDEMKLLDNLETEAEVDEDLGAMEAELEELLRQEKEEEENEKVYAGTTKK